MKWFAVVGAGEYELDVADKPGLVGELMTGMGIATVPLVGGGSLSWFRGGGCQVVLLSRPQ